MIAVAQNDNLVIGRGGRALPTRESHFPRTSRGYRRGEASNGPGPIEQWVDEHGGDIRYPITELYRLTGGFPRGTRQ